MIGPLIAGGKEAILYLLRVPEEPSAPSGSEGSLRVFKASPKYLRYRVVLWGLAQAASLAGLIIFDGFVMTRLRIVIPDFVANALWGLLALALLAFVVGFAITGLMTILDYEMRWYLVTDQCLRIREGLWNVREMTMTFANIQNISIEQGPLQRFLGIADLKVKSAGGGGGSHGGGDGNQEGGIDMHVGFFRGVDNAEDLRDLMRGHQQRAKSSGLGDPDDVEAALPARQPMSHAPSAGSGVAAESTVAAATIEGASNAADGGGTAAADAALETVLDELRRQARDLATAAERWSNRPS